MFELELVSIIVVFNYPVVTQLMYPFPSYPTSSQYPYPYPYGPYPCTQQCTRCPCNNYFILNSTVPVLWPGITATTTKATTTSSTTTTPSTTIKPTNATTKPPTTTTTTTLKPTKKVTTTVSTTVWYLGPYWCPALCPQYLQRKLSNGTTTT